MSGDHQDIAVLYIEDEPLARWTGAKLIEPLVGHLATAASCTEAEALWRHDDFDLVISDYRLEDGLAVDLVQRMRQSGIRTPVICLSGEAEDLALDGDFAAIIKKPLDAELLQQTIRNIQAARTPAQVEFFPGPLAAPEQSRPLPFWVAPEWSLSVAAAPSLELAPGRKGGVWLLLFGNATAPDSGRMAQPLVRVMFRQLADCLPETATAEKMLARCRDGLRRFIDSEHLWSLAVIHLYAGRVTLARDLDDRRWRVWLQDAGRSWKMLNNWRPAAEPLQALGCLIVATSSCEPSAEGARLAALFDDDAGASAARAGLRGLRLLSCPPLRRLTLSREQLAGGALTLTLRRLERTLLDDDWAPTLLRRLACGLLDLVVGLRRGMLHVAWDARQVTVTGKGESVFPTPADKSFFDEFDETDAAWRAVLVRDADDAVWKPQAIVWDVRDQNHDTAGFEVLPLPELLTQSEAEELRQKAEGWSRLALDAGRLSFAAGGALRVLREMADARRPAGGAPAGGKLCLLGCPPLLEAVLRSVGLDRDLDMVADYAALASLARRLTSMSERASILESVVKW